MPYTGHVPYPGKNSFEGEKLFDPPTPLRQNLKKVYPGKMIFVSGIPDSNSPRFSINIKDKETKNNAFHFDVRFDFGNDRNEIVRNARLNKTWGAQEKALDKQFPFARGKYFEIMILVEHNCFKVAVNDEHLLEFNHRYPIEKLDTLKIRGDVRLCSVRIQG